MSDQRWEGCPWLSDEEIAWASTQTDEQLWRERRRPYVLLRMCAWRAGHDGWPDYRTLMRIGVRVAARGLHIMPLGEERDLLAAALASARDYVCGGPEDPCVYAVTLKDLAERMEDGARRRAIMAAAVMCWAAGLDDYSPRAAAAAAHETALQIRLAHKYAAEEFASMDVNAPLKEIMADFAEVAENRERSALARILRVSIREQRPHSTTFG